MSFIDRPGPPSILFDADDDRLDALSAAAPTFFIDLNLDQIIDAVTASRAEYDLKPFFYFSLNRAESIQYRFEVFQDLENPALFVHVESFARRMRDIRSHLALANKLYYRFHKEGWFLHAVEIYCDAVSRFATDLVNTQLRSRGLLAIRDHFVRYVGSAYFTSLTKEARQLATDLARLEYCVLIGDNSFTVRNYASEVDYSAEIEETFKKFQQGAVKDCKVKYRFAPEDMNHIEAKILEVVARQTPELFSPLLDFCVRYANFIDETIAAFDREVHFYVAYLEHIAPFRGAGLRFCYPRMAARSKSVRARESFDLALAQKQPRRRQSSATISFWRAKSGSSSSPAQTREARRPSRACSGNCTTLRALAARCPATRPSYFCSTSFSLTSSERRRSRICAASWKTIWCAFAPFCSGQRRGHLS